METQQHMVLEPTQQQLVNAHITSHSNLFNSTIEYGITSVKVATLINGGAAIALLTFVANLGPTELVANAAISFSRALMFFGTGVFLGGLGAAIAYLTQLRYLEEFSLTGTINTKSKWRISLEYGTAALFLLAFGLFGFGVWQSWAAIFQPLSINPLDGAAALLTSIPQPTIS